MFTHEPDQVPVWIRDREIPQILRIHQFDDIDRRRFGICAFRVSKRNVGNRRFNAQDKGRPFDIELGESVLRLGVQVSAACSDIGVLPVSVQKCGIPDSTAYTVCIRMTMTQDIY